MIVNLINLILDEDKFIQKSKRIIKENKKYSDDIYSTNKSISQNVYIYAYVYLLIYLFHILNGFFFLLDKKNTRKNNQNYLRTCLNNI